MRKIFSPAIPLVAFLQGACGPAFVVGVTSDSDSGNREAGESLETGASTTSIDRQEPIDAQPSEVGIPFPLDASPLDASLDAVLFDATPTCTAIPFAARSSCPTTTGCSSSSCSDPLLYVPGSFWLECSSRTTPLPCQCAETYNCACLVRTLSPSCRGTLLCDPGAAAPALFLRCIPAPDAGL